MQSITIIGNLGKQAEVRTTQNGRQYLNFSVAVNSKRNNEVKTTWYEVLSFQEQHITKLTQYLRKGTQVVVVGELDPEANIYQDKTGQQKAYLRLIILTDKIEFVSSGNPNAQSTTGATSTVAEQYSKQNDDFNMGMGAKPQPQQSGYAHHRHNLHHNSIKRNLLHNSIKRNLLHNSIRHNLLHSSIRHNLHHSSIKHNLHHNSIRHNMLHNQVSHFHKLTRTTYHSKDVSNIR